MKTGYSITLGVKEYENGDIFLHIYYVGGSSMGSQTSYNIWGSLGSNSSEFYDRITYIHKHDEFSLASIVKDRGITNSKFCDVKDVVDGWDMDLGIPKRPNFMAMVMEDGAWKSKTVDSNKMLIDALDLTPQDYSETISKLDVLKDSLTYRQIEFLKDRLEEIIPNTNLILNNEDRIKSYIDKLDFNYIYSVQSYLYEVMGYGFAVNFLRGRKV